MGGKPIETLNRVYLYLIRTIRTDKTYRGLSSVYYKKSDISLYFFFFFQLY